MPIRRTASQLAPGALAQGRVEIRQRLVEQQHARFRRQRSRQRHPLLLAAGDLGDRGVEAGEIDQLERLGDARGACSRASPRGSSPNATFSPTVRWGKRA